mgnify:CR=1 FL=1
MCLLLQARASGWSKNSVPNSSTMGGPSPHRQADPHLWRAALAPRTGPLQLVSGITMDHPLLHARARERGFLRMHP